jgi:RNA polymerase sigma-70 factor (ECF subfamily)
MLQQDTQKSLLLEARSGNDRAWQDLAELYRPFIDGWARRHANVHHDAEDLAQEILLAVFRSLPRFEHNGRRGAFRTWLRTVAVHVTHDFWSARHGEARGSGDPDTLQMLCELEDVNRELARTWDLEHDRFVLRRLLNELANEFEPHTLQAFRRQALDGATAEVVAGELQLSLGAVYTAKSRVLQRLRQLSEGLLDWSGETTDSKRDRTSPPQIN